jgi:hypothetical protein
MDARTTLGGEEKTFLAMAAAMGGGCRTCAERLSAVAQSLDVDQEAIDRPSWRGSRSGMPPPG